MRRLALHSAFRKLAFPYTMHYIVMHYKEN